MWLFQPSLSTPYRYIHLLISRILPVVSDVDLEVSYALLHFPMYGLPTYTCTIYPGGSWSSSNNKDTAWARVFLCANEQCYTVGVKLFCWSFVYDPLNAAPQWNKRTSRRESLRKLDSGFSVFFYCLVFFPAFPGFRLQKLKTMLALDAIYRIHIILRHRVRTTLVSRQRCQSQKTLFHGDKTKHELITGAGSMTTNCTTHESSVIPFA